MPATPVVFTLPVTAPSAATVMLPLPAAIVLTGGTSLSPDSLRSAAMAMAPSSDSARAPPSLNARCESRELDFMAGSPGDWGRFNGLGFGLCAGCGQETSLADPRQMARH